jgi:hypothetical protein
MLLSFKPCSSYYDINRYGHTKAVQALEQVLNIIAEKLSLSTLSELFKLCNLIEVLTALRIRLERTKCLTIQSNILIGVLVISKHVSSSTSPHILRSILIILKSSLKQSSSLILITEIFSYGVKALSTMRGSYKKSSDDLILLIQEWICEMIGLLSCLSKPTSNTVSKTDSAIDNFLIHVYGTHIATSSDTLQCQSPLVTSLGELTTLLLTLVPDNEFYFPSDITRRLSTDIHSIVTKLNRLDKSPSFVNQLKLLVKVVIYTYNNIHTYNIYIHSTKLNLLSHRSLIVQVQEA